MKIDKNFPGKIQFWLNRNILMRKYSKIYAGPLKGYLWDMSTDYKYVLGIYEEKFVDILCMLANKKHSVFYDLGANYGYLSLVFKKVKPNSIVFAFEPFDKCLIIMKNHLTMNKIITKDFYIMEFAVSDSIGTIEFSNSDNLAANTYIKESPVFKKHESNQLIRTISLDQFVYQENNLAPDIIKINIEGAEFDALKGAERILTDSKPFLFLSTHDLHKPGVKKECLDYLINKDYTCFYVQKRISKGLEDYVCFHSSKKNQYSDIISFLSP